MTHRGGTVTETVTRTGSPSAPSRKALPGTRHVERVAARARTAVRSFAYSLPAPRVAASAVTDASSVSRVAMAARRCAASSEAASVRGEMPNQGR